MILVITMDATSHSTIVNPFTVSHDRNRPLSKNSGHCLETHTGSHLEVEETDSPDNTVISHSTIANSSTVFHYSTKPLKTNSGHCMENDAGSQSEDAECDGFADVDDNCPNIFNPTQLDLT